MAKRPTFRNDNDLAKLDFAEYHPTVVLRARRIDEPFTVVVDDQELDCEDGWLVHDPLTGALSAIDDAEFRRLYRPHYGDTVDRLADLATAAVQDAAKLEPPEQDDDVEALGEQIGTKIRAEAKP